jgi:radical SAM superfamily enzyme YgiQ (UPF0313 family)
VPSYFNAGHHLPVFQVAAYLRRRGIIDVAAVDAAALNASWRDICDLFVQRFDAIALFNDFDGIDTLERTVYYARRLTPGVRLIAFGRLSKQIPAWFERFDLDAIVVSGDYEAGVEAALCAAEQSPPGVRARRDGGFHPGPPGIVLPPDEWVFPDVSEIPYEAYARMYANDLNKFCGIPTRQELVVPVARGCPIGCAFCDVPMMQGRRERRATVERTVDYIVDSFRRLPFEYVSFYAPTFTLDRRWVLALCDALRARDQVYPWKCVTTLGHLDEDLIRAMAASGCVRVSVGLETLDPAAMGGLPRVKRTQESQLDRVAAMCASAGIELNCFVILGLPGDTVEGARYTVDAVLRRGARVRPTVYTPYHEMHENMTEPEIAMFNRQILRRADVSPETAALYHRIFFANEADRPTAVAVHIPIRPERAVP